jgi:hypothetical protein
MFKLPSNILMIRPVNFGFNEQTATSNAFQNIEFGIANKDLAQEIALKEFDLMVAKLREVGVNVLVIDDTLEPHTPDSIFPNNWISFHEDGAIITYPMQAENRRLERREEIVHTIENQFVVNKIIDLTYFEKEGKYLEGTGSMVLDRQIKIAYACISPRTELTVLNVFSEKTAYKIVAFEAVDNFGKAIYHTNVLMCVGSEFVVICLDAIPNEIERNSVVKSIEKVGKKIIEITLIQMNKFAGNMLEVKGAENNKYLVMSSSAFNSLTNNQIAMLQKYCKIIHSDLSMIEGNGGGSARCMMAEVCLLQKSI